MKPATGLRHASWSCFLRHGASSVTLGCRQSTLPSRFSRGDSRTASTTEYVACERARRTVPPLRFVGLVPCNTKTGLGNPPCPAEHHAPAPAVDDPSQPADAAPPARTEASKAVGGTTTKPGATPPRCSSPTTANAGCAARRPASPTTGRPRGASSSSKASPTLMRHAACDRSATGATEPSQPVSNQAESTPPATDLVSNRVRDRSVVRRFPCSELLAGARRSDAPGHGPGRPGTTSGARGGLPADASTGAQGPAPAPSRLLADEFSETMTPAGGPLPAKESRPCGDSRRSSAVSWSGSSVSCSVTRGSGSGRGALAAGDVDERA